MRNKSVLTIAVLMLIAGSVLTSCNSSSEKLENAKEDVTQANEDLDNANEKYLAEVASFQKETANTTDANKKSIEAFNERIAQEKEHLRKEYIKKIEALDKKNTDLKRRMETYKFEGEEKWESFKAEFKHDMDELGEAIMNLNEDNKK